jgi:phosphate acetyltransferase
MLSYSWCLRKGRRGKVRKATQIVEKNDPILKIEPIQYDAAVDMAIGQSKMPNSEVAGQASVLIFPKHRK